MTQKIALLGPQGTTPDVGAVVKDLGITGPIAFVRAGYQERESDDEALIASFGVPGINLTLHARGNDVFKNSPEFATAYQARQQRLRHMQGFYRTRLEGTETTDTVIRTFVGQTRPALRCVSGVCRQFPAFEGAKLEVVVRL